MSRLFRTVLLPAGLALLLTGAMLQPAAAAGARWSTHHEIPWLIVRGQPLTLSYAIDGTHKDPIRGVLYVRNSGQRDFKQLPLVARNGSMIARVPGSLATGARLSYYAVLRDPTGRSVTVTHSTFPSRRAPTSAREARACLATLASASDTTK